MEKKNLCPKTLNETTVCRNGHPVAGPISALLTLNVKLLLQTEDNTDISNFLIRVSSVFPGIKLAISKKETVTAYA